MLGVSIEFSPFDPHAHVPGAVPRPLHQLVSDDAVELARQAGMDPRDVSALREFASHRFLIVVRCPRTQAPAVDAARRAEPRRPRPYGGPQRPGVAARAPQWPA